MRLVAKQKRVFAIDIHTGLGPYAHGDAIHAYPKGSDEYERLIEITHYLERIGFKFREFGKNTIIIEGIPPDIEWGNEINIIKEILDQYLNSKDLSSSFIDQIAAIYACKSAIKAGDVLKPEERIHLINRLFATEHPYYCPHGRPIIVNLSIDELDQRFERI